MAPNYGTSLWKFFPNSGLRKFRHGKSAVVNKTRRRSTHHGWPHIVYYVSQRNALTPVNSILWISCTTCSYSYAAVNKILTDIARRAVRQR